MLTCQEGERVGSFDTRIAKPCLPLEYSATSHRGAEKAHFQGTDLYVKYLDDDVNDEMLREMFAACSHITSAKVEMDKKKGDSAA